ncbi:MAG: hypothetical protein LBR69_03295 [Endomicrobium sp.]|jgi:hypothetical protein|nr:hypothetical protein [Endomicrobium sp.]
MRRNKIVIAPLIFVLAAAFMPSCVSTNGANFDGAEPVSEAVSDSQSTSKTLTAQERAALAFYVYADFKSPLNHYYPSGWMGDTRDLSLDQMSKEYPYAGKNCIKIRYTPRGKGGWAGVFWQQPSNNWGDKDGGYNLSKATHITFWMRGESGGEVVSEVKLGGFKGDFPDSGFAVKKNMTLTTEWKLYHLSLKGKKLSRIAGGFSFTVNKDANPNGCTFYIDEIRYEMEK